MNFTSKQKKEDIKERIPYNSIYIKSRAKLQFQKLDQWLPLQLQHKRDQEGASEGLLGAGLCDLTGNHTSVRSLEDNKLSYTLTVCAPLRMSHLNRNVYQQEKPVRIPSRTMTMTTTGTHPPAQSSDLCVLELKVTRSDQNALISNIVKQIINGFKSS